MLKPTIISIAMVTVMASAAISPALGRISQAFPDASQTTIKLLLSVPAFMIIPFSFLSSYLTTKLTKRTVVMVGLVLFLVGGVVPQIVPNIEIILVLRLVLGAGVGLVMPLSMSLINDYFEGKVRTKMMGYNSAFSNLGGIVTMLLAGWLATFGWRIPFNVHFLGLIILFLVFFFLPKGEVQQPPRHKKTKSKIPFGALGYALILCGIMVAYYAIPTNIALFLDQNDIGGSTLAGSVVSFAQLGGMITSIFLAQIESAFKKFTVPIMLFGMGLAFFILAITNSVPLVIIAVCITGFGQGSLFPIIILKALDSVPTHQSDQATALTTSFVYLGEFLSPLVLDGVGKLANNATIRFQFGTLAAVILIAVAINLVVKYRAHKHKRASEST